MNKPTPKIYRTTNWSSYNRALTNRGNLTIWFNPKTQWYVSQIPWDEQINSVYTDGAYGTKKMLSSH